MINGLGVWEYAPKIIIIEFVELNEKAAILNVCGGCKQGTIYLK